MNASWIEKLSISNGLRVVFQPIIEVQPDGTSVYSLECLTRGPVGTALESPTILFAHARSTGVETELDRLCVQAALDQANSLPAVRLSLNVHASTLSKETDFPYFLLGLCATAGIDPSRLSVEIVETALPHDHGAFVRALTTLRAAGMRIALDDIGAGYSNYKMIVDTHPEYFKVDRYFVVGGTNDSYRMAVLESIALLARRVGARVVAEGVETPETLRAVTDAGIDLVQGYLFAEAMDAAAVVRYLTPRAALGL